MPYILRLAPDGWNKEKDDPLDDSAYDDNSVSAKAKRSAWARLIKKVYEVDPLICPRCGYDLRVMSIITNIEHSFSGIFQNFC